MEPNASQLAKYLEAQPGFEAFSHATTDLLPNVEGIDEPLVRMMVLLRYRGEHRMDTEFVRLIARPLRLANRSQDWYVSVGMQYIDKEDGHGGVKIVRCAYVEWVGADPEQGLEIMGRALSMPTPPPARHQDPHTAAQPRQTSNPSGQTSQPENLENIPRRGMFYDIHALPPNVSRKDFYNSSGQVRDFTDIGEDGDAISLPLWGADPSRNMPNRVVLLKNRPRPGDSKTRVTGGAETS